MWVNSETFGWDMAEILAKLWRRHVHDYGLFFLGLGSECFSFSRLFHVSLTVCSDRQQNYFGVSNSNAFIFLWSKQQKHQMQLSQTPSKPHSNVISYSIRIWSDVVWASDRISKLFSLHSECDPYVTSQKVFSDDIFPLYIKLWSLCCLVN